jgi:hypothetical protein
MGKFLCKLHLICIMRLGQIKLNTAHLQVPKPARIPQGPESYGQSFGLSLRMLKEKARKEKEIEGLFSHHSTQRVHL